MAGDKKISQLTATTLISSDYSIIERGGVNYKVSGIATRAETNTLLDAKQETLTASNGVQLVGVDVQGINATTSAKGVTQLSNAYNGTSQALATTEKAVSDGLATKQNTITTGTTAQYFRGDLSLSNFATDAKSVVVEDAINDGRIDKAPSQNAVFDALALKENADATILKQANIINNLTSTSTIAPLSANQGKILKDLVDTKVDKINIAGATLGSASKTITQTINPQGQVTSAAEQNISIPSSQVSDFTEATQDSVGQILDDTSTINFTYNDSTPSITADVKDASITNAKVANGIDATKIADGSVSNAEFQYLSNFAANVQSAVVEDAINNGVTNKAPSENAVFDALALKEDSANKGQANGYAGLDSAGKVPSSQLPAYVDDVLEFTNLASFPVIGETGKIYIALDTNLGYRWSGSTYTNIAKGDVQSVNTKTGIVVLNQDDILDGSTYKQYSQAEKTKLAGIAIGAEVNVQADWNQADNTKDDFINNKPTIPSSASQITNTPAGNVSATNVQSAINELDTEKADKTTVYTKTETNSLLSVFSTAGQLIYADVNNGSDATGDGTQLKPFKTLAGVIASSPNFGTKQAIYFQGVGNTGGGLVSTTNTTTIYIILSEKCELNTAITMPTTSGGLYILHGSITANIINNSTVLTGYLSLQNQVKIQATITNNSANYCEIQNLSSGDAANVTNTGTGLFSVINATTVNKLLNSGAGVINGIRIGTAKLPPEKSNGYLFLDGISNIVADASSNCIISSGTNAGILGINNINFLQSDFATQGKISQTNANAAHITLIGSTYSINQSSAISGFIKYTQDAVAICGLLSKRPSPLVNAGKLYEDENGKTYYSNGSNWVQVGYGKSEIDTALNLKEDAFTKNTAFNKNFGITAGSVAEGNDGRLGTKAIDETAIANNKIQVYNSATGKLEYQDKPTGSTNLSIVNKTSTTLDIASDNGNDATVPQATTTEAGLLIASDKVKLNNTTGTNTGDQDLSGLLTKADNLASVANQQTALNNITAVSAASTGQALVKKADGSAGFENLATAQNLIASYTSAERDSLTWSTGNVIYNTTYFRLEKYNGTSWIATDGSVGMLTFFDSVIQPLHYQVADGSQVSRTGVYSELWALNTSVNPSLTPSTFTITIANPAVITKTAHGLTNGQRVRFTTTGALPTGITTGVDYIVSVINANTFKLASTIQNLLAGIYITTTGTQSGVHSYTNTLYGQGNGTTTQNVADARGLFLRGTDSSRLINTQLFSSNGSIQANGLQAHTHPSTSDVDIVSPTSLNGSALIDVGGSGGINPSVANAMIYLDTLLTGVNVGSVNETRPNNYSSTIYIKYL